MLLHESLKNSAHKHPHKVAVACQKKHLTYADLDRLSDAFAIKLHDKGIAQGNRVALFLENSSEYVIAFMGILKSGAVAVPLNTQLVSRELLYLLNDCSPRFVITDSAHRSSFRGLMDPIYVLLIDKLDLSQKHEKFHPDIDLKDTELAMIIYTSGTTGKPKGVMLSHRNLNSNADSIIEYLDIKPSDSMMVVLPFFYSYGTSLLTTHIKAGAKLVIDNRFLYPNVVLDEIEKEGVTGFAGVPSHYAILLRKSALRKYKLNNLRYVTQAGGALAPSMITEFTQILPHVKFYVMYGQTEATARLTYLDPAYLNEKPASIGKAIPHVKVDILDEHGQKVEQGQTGEIVARGDNLMLGYWDSPKETSNVLKKEGLWTGDLARMDEDGFIYLVSRKKEMIKSGANRISPLEIEDVVRSMPGVLECAAVGVADEILGEAIKLCVVKNGINFTENDLLLYCKKNLASYKIPKFIEFRKELPKTTTGKLRRMELV